MHAVVHHIVAASMLHCTVNMNSGVVVLRRAGRNVIILTTYSCEFLLVASPYIGPGLVILVPLIKKKHSQKIHNKNTFTTLAASLALPLAGSDLCLKELQVESLSPSMTISSLGTPLWPGVVKMEPWHGS